MNDLLSFLDSLGQPRILVLGDAMLDCYTWGTAERVSPEAPVLVLRADERDVRLGGAASVALLLSAMEAETTLASVIGDDHDGRTLRRLLDEAKIDASSLVIDPHRPTTTKERFLGRSERRQPHQMLRVDTESRAPLDDPRAKTLIESFLNRISEYDAVLISDYAKGVCTPEIVATTISCCRTACIPILVDPGRGVDFANFRGATLLKPNRLEAELAFGQPISSAETAIAAAESLRARFDVDVMLITLDRDGMVYTDGDHAEHIQITPQAVCDITGAGDTVLATLGLCLSAGLPVRHAGSVATVAAGLQIQQPGVTPISRKALAAELEWHHHTQDLSSKNAARSASKIISLEAAAQLAREYRQQNRTIVFTNGCFDLLHVGHVTMLERAANEGNVLFVAINSDDSVRQLKGLDRPVIDQHDRARMLSALGCVDHVLIFDDATPHRLLTVIRPDVLVKGGTTAEIVGREIVEAYCGRVFRTDESRGRSTTSLLHRLRDTVVENSAKEMSPCD